jgi:hypothetical protein
MTTRTNRYLQEAKDKRKSNKKIDYNVNLYEFICQCYIKLNPNTYGTYMENAIKNLLRAKKMKKDDELGDISIGGKYYEVKTSYLGQSGDTYTITHIRQWQKFNYYLLCFIDCDNDFTPHFYVLNKNVMDMIKVDNMNGTSKSNIDNAKIEKRVTVKVGSDIYNVIVEHNILKDTTFDSLCDFVNEQRKDCYYENHIVL